MKPGRGSLICFTGIDGSGKTTHARSLIRFLRENNYSCDYVWAASRPILSLAFFGATRLLGYWKETRKGEYTDPLEFAPNELRIKLGAVWRLLLFVDFQLKVTLMIRTRLFLGKTVVCDRYAYDLLMELRLSRLNTAEFERILWKTLPRPTAAFLMDVSEEAAMSRRQIPTERLSARRDAFLKLAGVLNVTIINANNDFLHNSQRIRSQTLRLIA